MLALEDGSSLRLLAGIDEQELAAGEPFAVSHSPTRFGRIALRLEPGRGAGGWTLQFQRGAGPAPGTVEIPESLGAAGLVTVKGAGFRRAAGRVMLDPSAPKWEAAWHS
jgi:hypothetical protein